MKKIVIIGGGTAGISMAARLKRKARNVSITLFEPSEYHFYQPMYTLVGGGADKKEKTKRKTADYIPSGVNWEKKRIASFEPKENIVVAEDGDRYPYDFLIVAPGIQLDWHLIEGLQDTLGKNGVCSVYGYQESEQTFEAIRSFKGGNAVFTAGSTPVKCGGASQKIMYLAESYFRKHGLRDKTKVVFASAGTKLFGVPGYAEALEKVVQKKGIETQFFHELVKVEGDKKLAYFKVKEMENGEVKGTREEIIAFDLLHVVPPQSAPDFIKNSPLSIQEGKMKGWLNVDHFTLQHNEYPNIFGMGDACGLPTAKTGAAIRKQLPVVTQNLLQLLNSGIIAKPLKYNGYSACPILTDYHHVVMAEFTYGNKPSSSFFFNTKRPLWIMYLLKHYVLPFMYWRIMLRGRG